MRFMAKGTLRCPPYVINVLFCWLSVRFALSLRVRNSDNIMEDNRSVTPAATVPQPAGKTPGNSNNRVAIIVAAAVAAIFIGVAIYMWSRLRSTESEMAEMVEMMTYEKEQL